MKYAFAFTLWLSMLTISAQQTFTDRLQQVAESAGRIVLHQDKSITDLVNGTPKKPVAKPVQRKQVPDSTTSTTNTTNTTNTTTSQESDSMSVDSLLLGPKVKMNGFRIQVYFGDNSRQGKTEAQATGRRFRNTFPELPVYVSFVSPHWLCRAGDFRTMEEASETLRLIREMGIFREAVIVKSKINVRL